MSRLAPAGQGAFDLLMSAEPARLVRLARRRAHTAWVDGTWSAAVNLGLMDDPSERNVMLVADGTPQALLVLPRQGGVSARWLRLAR